MATSHQRIQARLARPKRVLPLTKWDDEMVALLAPLATAMSPPILILHFFANTFPLAYHYAVALKSAREKKHARINRARGDGIDEFIRVAPWGTTTAKEENTLAYVSATSCTRDLIPVTVFRPRWAFVPLNLATSRIWTRLEHSLTEEATKQQKHPALGDFLKEARRARFGQLTIYAELEKLGDFLKECVGRRFSNTTLLVAQGGRSANLLPAFDTGNPTQSVLRLFIYGGSMSSYLLRKNNRYLPVELPESIGANHKFTDTYLQCSHREWHGILIDYHERLYSAAKQVVEQKAVAMDGLCPPFFTVYRAYNELAWLSQNRSSFASAKDFAQCLHDHHRRVPDR